PREGPPRGNRGRSRSLARRASRRGRDRTAHASSFPPASRPSLAANSARGSLSERSSSLSVTPLDSEALRLDRDYPPDRQDRASRGARPTPYAKASIAPRPSRRWRHDPSLFHLDRSVVGHRRNPRSRKLRRLGNDGGGAADSDSAAR